MKKIFLLFVLLTISTFSFAQSNYQDVVYLKNGSVIRGIIIEQVPNQTIKIETADRNVFVYKIDEIEKLTKEVAQGKSNFSNTNSGLNSGYQGIVEMGYAIGIGDYGMDFFKLNIINGYKIKPFFAIGFGTGIRYYSDADAALIPLFADFRSNFINNTVSPYLAMGVGYTLNASNDLEGVGLLLNPSAGVSIKIGNKSALNFGIGYEMQKMTVLQHDYYYYRLSKETSGSISINTGISF